MKARNILIFTTAIVVFLFASSVAVFALTEKPADPTRIERLLESGGGEEKVTEALMESYPLDKTKSERFWSRYWRWLTGRENVDQLSHG